MSLTEQDIEHLLNKYDPAAYSADHRRHGIRKAAEHIQAGQPALGFLAVVESVEQQLRVEGHGTIRIPAMDGFRRLADETAAKRRAQLVVLDGGAR